MVRWATPQLHDIDALAKMVDPALEGMYPVKSLSRFADVIALCVQVMSQIFVVFLHSGNDHVQHCCRSRPSDLDTMFTF